MLSLILFLSPFVAQEHVVYHRIYIGNNMDKPVVIDAWNNNSGKKQIRETFDDKNRVTKIEFLRNGELTEFGNFPVAKVTYEYDGNKIIETTFDKHEQNLYVDKHVSHYQSIYYLDQDGFIEKAERISDFETINPVWAELEMQRPSKAALEKESQAYCELFYKDKPLEIEFYRYSFYKLDGVYPISKNYNIETNYEEKYADSWMEKGIEEGVKKLIQSIKN